MVALTSHPSPTAVMSKVSEVDMSPAVLATAMRVGGSNCVTRQSNSTSRPIARIRVWIVLPTATGAGDVSSSEITVVSHFGRLLTSVKNSKASCAERAIETVSVTVNIGLLEGTGAIKPHTESRHPGRSAPRDHPCSRGRTLRTVAAGDLARSG